MLSFNCNLIETLMFHTRRLTSNTLPRFAFPPLSRRFSSPFSSSKGKTMDLQFHHTDDAPAAIGPYSQAVSAGDTVYISGCIAMCPKSGQLVGNGDVKAEAKQALANMDHILRASGSSRCKVVKTTVLLTDMANFAGVNEVYAEFFGDHRPARACFAVKGLPKNSLVEIEAVAIKE